MGTTNSTSQRTNWDAILQVSEMRKASIDFALGTLSGETYKEMGTILGVGSPTRNLFRNRRICKVRQAARKALKRRAILTEKNLVNPLMYAQL